MAAIDGVGDLKGDSVVSLDVSDAVSSSPRVLSLDMSAGNIRYNLAHKTHRTPSSVCTYVIAHLQSSVSYTSTGTYVHFYSS